MSHFICLCVKHFDIYLKLFYFIFFSLFWSALFLVIAIVSISKWWRTTKIRLYSDWRQFTSKHGVFFVWDTFLFCYFFFLLVMISHCNATTVAPVRHPYLYFYYLVISMYAHMREREHNNATRFLLLSCKWSKWYFMLPIVQLQSIEVYFIDYVYGQPANNVFCVWFGSFFIGKSMRYCNVHGYVHINKRPSETSRKIVAWKWKKKHTTNTHGWLQAGGTQREREWKKMRIVYSRSDNGKNICSTCKNIMLL